mmetsp:Transcript_5041/g.8592  ORF Transcript_5041/g.8592 Transcript_5041/m.8592 type:complete len:99 (+) Transcript_5041:283-579(+)
MDLKSVKERSMQMLEESEEYDYYQQDMRKSLIVKVEMIKTGNQYQRRQLQPIHESQSGVLYDSDQAKKNTEQAFTSLNNTFRGLEIKMDPKNSILLQN